MHLSFLLLLGCSALVAHALGQYEIMNVPFKIENGTRTIEQVFLEYQTHSVLYDEDVALNVTVISSDYISFAADQCGRRLLETAVDIKNATWIWTKQFMETLQNGIAKHCTVITEFAMDFIIDCQGPCSGKIIFNIIPFPPDPMDEMEQKFNPSFGDLQFETVGGGVPAIVSSDVGIVLEAVFISSRNRFEITVDFPIEHTLAIGKCGVEFLKLAGGGERQKHVLQWQEVRQLRFAKSMQCEGSEDESIDYMMSSEEKGSGTVSFIMLRGQPEDVDHPGPGKENVMELERGVPKHHLPPKAVSINFSPRITVFFVLSLVMVIIA